MKKLITSSIFLLLVLAINAQVTLNKRYEYSTSIVQLETLGYKYYLMDVPNGQCKIYNIDHSWFRTINCNIPNGFYLSDIKFISENIFDSDAEIELLCTYYKYNNSGAYYQYNSKIINEDGSPIISIDGGLYNYINKAGENTYKLFSYCYDFSDSPEKVWTNIYNIPGNIVSEQVIGEKSADVSLNIFPNPATQRINVAYKLPQNTNSGNLFMIDNSGQLVKQFTIDNHTDHLALDVNEYKSGIYYYFIEYGNTRTPSKKLVIR